MKKILLISFLCVGIVFISIFTKKKPEDSLKHLNQVENTSVSPQGTMVEMQTNDEESSEGKVWVMDETGKKRRLKLGNINETDKASYLIVANPTGRFAQVVDGHYYYLESDGKRNYTIFRDKRIVVGKFSLKQGFVSGFIKSGSEYYAFIQEEEGELDYIDAIKWHLVHINLKTQSVENLVENFQDVNFIEQQDIYYDGIYEYLSFYKGNVYYDAREEVSYDVQNAERQDGDEDFYAPGKYIIKLNLQDRNQENSIFSSGNMNKAKPYLTFVDGKILYGKQKKNEVILYSFDLETQKETKFFQFKRKKAYKCYGAASYDCVFLTLDEKYIYCQDFAIPRKGGKMQRLLKNAVQYDNGQIAFSSNRKYIYYLDGKFKLHRVDKKTGEDTQICKKKLMSVHCTEENVYVKKYNRKLLPGYWDEDSIWVQKEDDPASSVLYCMDLAGRELSVEMND